MSAATPIRPQSAQLPEALAAYLADQQDRARELQDTLERLARTFEEDNGALVLAARVAGGINEALDSNSLRKVLEEAQPA